MTFWSSKKVFVTGGAGFIGSHLVDRLIGLGALVTVGDNLSKGSVEHLFDVWSKHGLQFRANVGQEEVAAGPHRFIRCDFEDPAQTREVLRGQEVVIHLAATIGGRGYIDTHPADCCDTFAINHNIAKAALTANVDRVSYASTACIYPVHLQSDYDSDYLLEEYDGFRDGWANCDKEYGWAKFMGEVELWAYYEQHGLKCSIMRYVTAYGPRQNDTHAIIALIKRAVERKDPYVVWGTGEQDRDFTYVDDIAQGTLLACEKITDGMPINLGTSKRYKIKDVAHLILRLTGHNPSQIVFDTSKPEGVMTRALDIGRAQRLLGWEPKVSLEDGLRRTIEWYVKARPPSAETIVS